MHNWIASASSNEPVHLQDIAKLSDLDRMRLIGERVFDPGIIQHPAKHHHDAERGPSILDGPCAPSQSQALAAQA